MGYYRHSSSPYDVQSSQGGRFTFATVKERYQQTKPIQGKRKALNIRPIKRRDRAWERIIEVNENEYYVSFDAYMHRTHHNRGITWKMSEGMEYMTIHTPRRVWSSTDPSQLYPRTLSSSSVFWFYDFNLPTEFSMDNYYTNKYVRFNNKFYSIELGDITFQRKQGGGVGDWQPLVVHREFKHHIDRAKTKELRESIKPFVEYFDVMSGIVEEKHGRGNPIVKAIVGEEGIGREVVLPEQVKALFKPTDNGVPDSWLKMVERYKRKIIKYDYRDRQSTLKRHKLEKEICKDLFYLMKPCKDIEVPLGTLTIDKYKSWFR
jgi:hypothetical protein